MEMDEQPPQQSADDFASKLPSNHAEQNQENSQSTPSSMDTPALDDNGPASSQEVCDSVQNEPVDLKFAEFSALLKRIEDTCRQETSSRFRPPTAATTALLQGVSRVAFRIRALQDNKDLAPAIFPIEEVLSLGMLVIKSSQKSSAILCCALELLEKVVTNVDSLSEAETSFILECLSLFKIRPTDTKRSNATPMSRSTSTIDDQIGIVTPEVSPKLLQLVVSLCATLDLTKISPKNITFLVSMLLDLAHGEDENSRAIAIGAIQLLLTRAFRCIEHIPNSLNRPYPPRSIIRRLLCDQCPEFSGILEQQYDDTSPTNQTEALSLVVADQLLLAAEDYCQSKIRHSLLTDDELSQFGGDEKSREILRDFLGLSEITEEPSPKVDSDAPTPEKVLSAVLAIDTLSTVLVNLSSSWNGNTSPALLGWLRTKYLPFVLKAVTCMSLITLPLSIVVRILDLTGKLLTTPILDEESTTIFGLTYCPEETALYIYLLGRHLRFSDAANIGSRKKQIIANQYLIETVFGNRATLHALIKAHENKDDPLRVVVSSAILRALGRSLHELVALIDGDENLEANSVKETSPDLTRSYTSFAGSKTQLPRQTGSKNAESSTMPDVPPKDTSYLTVLPWSGLNSSQSQTYVTMLCSLPLTSRECSTPGDHIIQTPLGEVNLGLVIANWQRSRQWISVTGNSKAQKADQGMDEQTACMCGIVTANCDSLLSKLRNDLLLETFLVLTSTLTLISSILTENQSLWQRVTYSDSGPWIYVRRPIVNEEDKPLSFLQPICRALLSLAHSLTQDINVDFETREAIMQAALLSYTCGDCNTPLEVLADSSMRLHTKHTSWFLLITRLAVHAGSNLRPSHINTLTKLSFSLIARNAEHKSPIHLLLTAANWHITDSELLTTIMTSLHLCMSPTVDQSRSILREDVVQQLRQLVPVDAGQSPTGGRSPGTDERDAIARLEFFHALFWPRLHSLLFAKDTGEVLLSSCLADSMPQSIEDLGCPQEEWLLYQAYLCILEMRGDRNLAPNLLESLWRICMKLRNMCKDTLGLQILQLLCTKVQQVIQEPQQSAKDSTVELLLNLMTLVVVEFAHVPNFIAQALDIFGNFGASTPELSKWHQAFWDSAAVMLAVACHLVSKSGFGLYKASEILPGHEELIVLDCKSDGDTGDLNESAVAKAAFALVEKLLKDHNGSTMFPTSSLNIISRCLLCLSHKLSGSETGDSASTEKDLVPLKSISFIWQACDSLVTPTAQVYGPGSRPVCVGGERFMLLGQSNVDPTLESRWPVDVSLRSVVEDPEDLLYRMAGELTKLATDGRVAVRISAIKSLSTMLSLRARSWTQEKWHEFFHELYEPILANAHAQRIVYLQQQVDLILEASESLSKLDQEKPLEEPMVEYQSLVDAWDETLVFCVETGLPRIDIKIIDCVVKNETHFISMFFPSVLKLLEAEGRLFMKHKQSSAPGASASTQALELESVRLKKLTALVAKLLHFLSNKQCITFGRCIKWLLRWSMLPTMEPNKCSLATASLFQTIARERGKFERKADGSMYLRHSEAIDAVGNALDGVFIDGLSEALTKIGHYLCVEKKQDLTQLDEIVKFKSGHPISNCTDSDESIQIFLKLLGACLGITIDTAEEVTVMPSNVSKQGETSAPLTSVTVVEGRSQQEGVKSDPHEYSILEDKSDVWTDLTRGCCESTNFLSLWDDEMAKDDYYERVHVWQVSNFFTPEENCLSLYQEAQDHQLTYLEIDDLRHISALKSLGCPGSILTLTSFMCSSRFINGLIKNEALADKFLCHFIYKFIHPEFYKSCCSASSVSALTILWSQVALWFVTRLQRDYLQQVFTVSLWTSYRKLMNYIRTCLLSTMQSLLPLADSLPLCHRIFEVFCITLENELCFVSREQFTQQANMEVLKQYWDHWSTMLSITESIIQTEAINQQSMIGQSGRALTVFKGFVESSFLRQADYCLWQMAAKNQLSFTLINDVVAFVSRPIQDSVTNDSKCILRHCGTWNAFLSLLHLCDSLQGSQKVSDEESEAQKEQIFSHSWKLCLICLNDCVRCLKATVEHEKAKTQASALSRMVGLLSFGGGRKSTSPESDPIPLKEAVQRTISLLSVLATVSSWERRKDEVVPQILKVIAELMIVDDKELRIALRSSMLAFL